MARLTSEREALLYRTLPEMTLSDGSAESKTPALDKVTAGLPPQMRALKRFAVDGNVVITGGTGTLGVEAARALLEHGAAGLALWDLYPSQAEDVVEKLKQDFPEVHILVLHVDVTDSESILEAAETTAGSLGSIDVLCCFAGIVNCTHATDITAESWRHTLDVNITGVFLCTQAIARHMIRRGQGGSMVLMASISGHRVNYPQPQVAYNVSKSALLHLAHSLAAEWAIHGIRVNTLSPGYMDTVLNEGNGLANARRIWSERTPMGRMGLPFELTGPLVLLCSRYGGAFITGTDLVVDGGNIVF